MSAIMKPDDRKVWILKWIKEHSPQGVDVLNSDFVDDYVAATGVRMEPTCWGASKCPTLGSDLSAMARCGALDRGRIGLGANWQPGFPKWVWAYWPGRAAYLYEPKESKEQL